MKMIDFLKRTWDDIRHGENLDAYITVAVALILSILNLLGVASSSSLPAITLGVLALLAIASVVNRHRVEDLAAKLSPSAAEFFVGEFNSSSFKEDLIAAREIWLYGASLVGVCTDNYSLFERSLKHGTTIRVMVVDPNFPQILELSELRSYANPSVQRAKDKCVATLSDFCELRKLAPDKLQIRTLKFPITHRLVALNPHALNGKLYVSNYPFATPGGTLPKFILNAKDGRWYDLYIQEAENLWRAGTDWTCFQ
jgi:hypothetical protein